MKPFFSIIVPVYQSEKYLEDTVQNLMNQTFKNIEIILIDDGSTDKSSDICDKLAILDGRIKVIHTRNSGASVARNLGIKICQGKWIIFVDSDDIVSKRMCENFYNYIYNNSFVDFIICNFALESSELIDKVTEKNEFFYLKGIQQNIDLIKQMLLSDYSTSPKLFKENFGNNVVLNSPCAKAYKHEYILENNLKFRPQVKYSEDMLFNLEVLASGGKGIFVNDAVYFYRVNLDSVTHQQYFPNIVENYFVFRNVIKSIINDNKWYELQSALDIFSFKSALGVVPRDIFRPSNSICDSYKRMEKVISSTTFLSICNLKLLDKYNKYFDLKTKVKGKLVLGNHFLILFLIYKGFIKL